MPLSELLRIWRQPYVADRVWDEEFPVAWIASNCDFSASSRQAYVAELGLHIGVASYGSCLNNRRLPGASDDLVNQFAGGFPPSQAAILSRHRFYLSLENANCDYWVTEKLYKAFQIGAIPLVDGPEDYSPFIPSNNRFVTTVFVQTTQNCWAPDGHFATLCSVIRIDDFPDPADLAAYLKRLIANPKEFESYFR